MYKTVEKILLEFDPVKKDLLPALRKIGASFGYVDEKEAEKVADYFNINLAKVYETASFYDLLKTEKEPELVVQICSGGNCTVNNSFQVIKTVESFLGIKAGDEFNPKKKIEIISCLGRCGNGPIVIINGKVFEKVIPSKVEEIFRGFI